MFSIADITLFNFSFGPSITAVGHVGPGLQAKSPEHIENLAIQWHDVGSGPLLFSLLSWHSEISHFSGRKRELEKLHNWAASGPKVWIKFLTGHGGTGKSRLAAEFARQLQGNNWAAGFVDLRKDTSFPMEREGTLLVIDYPEENIDGVKELLRELTWAQSASPLRVLLLTRQTHEKWDEIIDLCNAVNLVDTDDPIEIHGIDDPASAHRIYHTALERASEEYDTTPSPVSETALSDWLRLAPENHRALFLVAAAVYSAVHPNDEVVRYTGSDVIKELVRREVGRLQRIAEGQNLTDNLALARLLAMAAIADEITPKDIDTIAAESGLSFGFKSDDDVKRQLTLAGILSDGKLQAPKPDIVAAAFTVDVLGRDDDIAPELVWHALAGDIEGGLERIGRLCYDAEVTLGIKKPCISGWMAEAVKDNVDRCEFLKDPFWDTTLPIGWLPTAINIWRTLLNKEKDDEGRAHLLNNLSTGLDDIGDTAGALEAIKEAVDLYRKLAAASPARFELDLAMSLNNVSVFLSNTGDTAVALEVSKEASDLYRRLAATSPARFEPNLATSLNNLSAFLSDTGDTAGALEAIKEASDLYRKLAAASPARFEPYLASSLNNLSADLSATGDNAGAQEAIKEAVVIKRRLAAASPSRFESDLAVSCGAYGQLLILLEKYSDAAASFKEGADLIKPYAEKWPGSPNENFYKMLIEGYNRAMEMMK